MSASAPRTQTRHRYVLGLTALALLALTACTPTDTTGPNGIDYALQKSELRHLELKPWTDPKVIDEHHIQVTHAVVYDPCQGATAEVTQTDTEVVISLYRGTLNSTPYRCVMSAMSPSPVIVTTPKPMSDSFMANPLIIDGYEAP